MFTALLTVLLIHHAIIGTIAWWWALVPFTVQLVCGTVFLLLLSRKRRA